MTRLAAWALRTPETSTRDRRRPSLPASSLPRRGPARRLPELFDDQEDVVPRGGEPRSHGGPTQVDHPEPLLPLEGPPAVPGDRLGKGGELRPQRHGHRFLQLRPSDLDDGAEFLFLFLEGSLEVRHGPAEAPQAEDPGDLDAVG